MISTNDSHSLGFRSKLKFVTRGIAIWSCLLVNFLLGVALAAPCVAQQGRDYTTEAGVDSDGNIYVVPDAGKRIKMATVGHCIEARFADDKQTIEN